mgnify:CR=1 FL=1
MTPRKRNILFGGIVGSTLILASALFVLSTNTSAPAVQYLTCEIADIDVEWSGTGFVGDLRPGQTVTIELIQSQGRWIQHAPSGSRSVKASWLPDRIVAKSGQTSIARSDLSIRSNLIDVFGKLEPVNVLGQCQVTEMSQDNKI